MRTDIAAITSQLKEKLSMSPGRHLYAVLGSYEDLDKFEEQVLARLQTPWGSGIKAVNLNNELLTQIEDAKAKELKTREAQSPKFVEDQLKQYLENLLRSYFDRNHLLVLKNLELLFIYQLDLNIFRVWGANQNHILLLLPGEKQGERIQIFSEEDRFKPMIPGQLLAADHIWEI